MHNVLRKWARTNFRFKIFIHIPKNAGVSLRSAFRRFDFVKVTIPYHMRVRDLIEQNQENRDYFGVVRNPWSRVASRYFYAKRKCIKWRPDDPRRVFVEKSSFKDFVMFQPSFDIPQHPGKPWLGPFANWFDQLDWLSDGNGIVVAQCLRFEHLGDDLCEFLGRQINLPVSNRSSHSIDYRKLYTPDMYDAVLKRHQRDIDYFGFDFEGGAKKNFYKKKEPNDI